MHTAALLLATVGVAGAADYALVPLDEPVYTTESLVEKPEVPGLGKETEPFGIGVIGLGTERRVDGPYFVERDNGELIDGGIGLGLRRVKPGRSSVTVTALTAVAGTDQLAAHDGVFIGGLSLTQGSWRGLIPLYDLRLHGGYSRERKGVFEGDVTAGLLHLAAARDHEIDSFRIGGAIDGPPGLVPGRIGIDRVVGYRDSQRNLATQTWLELGVPVREGLFLAGNASYTFDAVDVHGEEANVWQVWLGLGLRW
jgi:hypothetical protein